MKMSQLPHATSLCLLLAAPVATAANGAPVLPLPQGHQLRVYTSAQGALTYLQASTPGPLNAAVQVTESETAVFVNTRHRFQTVLGIGGAVTDATAEVFAQLKPAQQDELLRAWFDPLSGMGYSLLRTTIHSSDFSPASYTYINEGDAALKTFSIAHDHAYRLPMVKRAMAAAKGPLTVYASPWSAPAFMKTNASMVQGGKLLPEFANTWALYIAKFIQAWEAEGVPLWGITIQNEPMAVQRWESMIYTAEEERDFLKNHLGPVLRAQGLGEKKIVVWDHNRDLIAQRADTILSDPEAAQYVWGVGYHWYETWSGGEPMVRNVAAVQAAWPKINLLLTEATVERYDPTRLYDWANAERYGSAMIQDFNAGAVGWTDWNLLLDETGGPNHVGNFCFAPVHADTRTGDVHYTPSFFYFGHFSKFIRPGAVRVSATTSRSALEATAFRNPDGSVATVIMNRGATAVTYVFQIDGQQTTLTIAPRAIQTVVQ